MSFKGVIIDAPWAFATYSAKGITRKGAGGQYSTMTLDEIKKFPIADHLAPDAWVLMWTTWPMLRHGLETLDAWGLSYCTGGAWAKQSKTGAMWAFGTGYVLRSASEPFLIGKKGKPKPMSRSARNLLVAPVREHSRKPDSQYALMESLSEGPWAEFFSRAGPREGWTMYGDEVGKFGDDQVKKAG